jgi:hypothetical protein
MARYSISTSTIDDDDDEPPPSTLSCVGGPAIGLPTERWPRHRGRCMQHAFTLDLDGLEPLGIPKAEGMRALSVFVESYYDRDLDSSDGITVVWLSQADVDAHPTTEPPADFVADPLTEEMQSRVLQLEPLDADDEPASGECYLGGEPVWSDAGPPAELPPGAFVLQIDHWSVPFSRSNAQLFVFENGAYAQRAYPDDESPVPWPEAIARSRRIVVLEEPPAADALQKWGGLPRGVSEDDWPAGTTHLFTYVPPEWPEDEDGVAIAVFGRLSTNRSWGDQPGFFETRTITADALEDEEDIEAPEGVTVLEARALELRPFPADATWRDLQQSSFVGPRPAWRDPSHRNADSTREPVLQVASELLPSAPGRGSLCFLSGNLPYWMPEPGAPQTVVEPYRPDGTLYADDTTAAVVVGRRIDFERYSILPEQVEALEQSLLAALKSRGLELTLFVPGDTTTSPDSEIPGKFVLGTAVATTEANDWEPSRVDHEAAERLLADFPALDEAFWEEALAGFDAEPSEEPATYLLSWGPLCYGALYVGVARSKDDPGSPVHKFVANQDMEQEWSSQGIDGVRLESAEFSDICELSLSPAEDLPRAAPLVDPHYWLICRYD